MEFIGIPTYTPPLEIEGLPVVISGIVLSDAEKKQVQTSRELIATVDRIGANTCPPASWNQYKCALQDHESAAWQELSDNPSLEAAEKYNTAAARLADTEKTGESISAAIAIPPRQRNRGFARSLQWHS